VDLRAAGLTLVLAGCDWVVDLHHLRGSPDAVDTMSTIDAVSVDAPLGHDEDGDGIADTGDVCPNVYDPAQTDTDGDGVGDICDPHPHENTDRIVYFEPFANIDRWTTVGVNAQWTLEADTWRQASASTVDEIAVFDTAVVDPTIIATMSEIAGATSPDAGVFIAPAFPILPRPPSVICYDMEAVTQLDFYENRNNENVGNPVAMQPGGADPVTIVAAAHSEGGGPFCAGIRSGATNATRAMSLTNQTPIAMGYVGLYTYGASATFRSVLIIGHD
jgi:hypothetical protein